MSDWRKKDELAKAELMQRLEQSGEKERYDYWYISLFFLSICRKEWRKINLA